MRWLVIRVRRRLVPALAAALSATCYPAHGEPIPDPAPPRYETISGVDISLNSVFGYFGAVWAVGRNVTAEGPRIKLLAGKGRYDYTTGLPGIAGRSGIQGQVDLFQALAGYQWRRGEWTVKTYAGFASERHALTPNDPSNAVNGRASGAAVQLEVWRNLGEAGFVSFDASYASPFKGHFAQGRLGRRLSERLSLGLEGAALGNEEYQSGRGGGFISLRLGQTELTVSGGISGDYYGDDMGAYGALSVYGRF